MTECDTDGCLRNPYDNIHGRALCDACYDAYTLGIVKGKQIESKRIEDVVQER